MSRFSIRTLLIISILLPLSVVYALSMAIDIGNSRAAALRNVQIDLRDTVSRHAAQVDSYFSSAAQIPKTLAATLSAEQTLNEGDFEAILREKLQTFPRLVGIGIAFEPDELRETKWYVYRSSPGSAEIFSLGPAEELKKNYVTRDWYRIPKETGQAAWSEPYFDQGASGLPMCTYSVPIFREGRFAGAVMVDVGLEDIQELLFQIAEKNRRYYLLSAKGMYAVATDAQLGLVMTETIFCIAEKYQKEELAQAGHNMLQGKPGILAYNRVIDERRVWIAYTPLPVTGWTLKVAMDEVDILQPVYAIIYHTVLHFLIEFIVILAVIVFVAGRLTIPIQRLAKFAEELAAGNLDAQIGNVQFAQEIDQLTHTFDKMVVDLKSNIEQRIKEETARQTVEGELKAARRIQTSLLPHTFPPFPERKEFNLHAMNKPVAIIAGDFFDFFFIKPDTLAFVIADVSGHGMPAAFFMAVSRTAIRTFAAPDHSPHEIINQVNKVLSVDNDDMMFVTLFYGHYNVGTGELTYVNAGHEPPYIVRSDGRLETLLATGPLVATFEDISYEERTVCLEPGDLLATFTDGVTEAHSSQDYVLYGTERLSRLLGEIRSNSVEEICNRIYQDTDHFAGHECQDDVTLLVLRRNSFF